MPSHRAASLLLALSPCLIAQTPASPAPLDGIWLGTLHTGGPSLRIQIHLHQDAAGKWTCSLDSLDQNGVGIPCTLSSATNPIAIDIPAVHAKWSGSLTANTLDGTFTQGADMPLTLERQSTMTKPTPPATPDAALPPADATTIRAILDKDLAAALSSGALAPSTNAGVTIGVLAHGKRTIFTYGTAKPDSVFEIGSISKTFTGLLLAQMVEQKSVQLNEPVRDLLPPGTVAKPASGSEITLLDLSDQHSGLPRMPDNFAPADTTNPYADYDSKLLYADIAHHGVSIAPGAPFGYSNLGVGLLGSALANRANLPYNDLLHQQITGPLNMTDTSVVLSPSMRSRLIQGHDAAHNSARPWDLDALAGAGGIRSTAADMLTYLEAQLHPNQLPATAASTPQGKTLPAAILASHTIHADVPPGMHIALNWFRADATGNFWHNGATGGYSSFALFNPDKDFAFIVLFNTTISDKSFADRLGQHIAQRLAGDPAVSLAN
ncbi:serine hydrolase [Granulicella sp. L60]|uniref:serine hydrolase domain-containing protein n=1 Tax=Granulicella sp. L60 TaxID=1641866 RepID=UPI00131AB70F|nr:serine hydrolase domain-containing protein [Granulicella sp. L60]